MERSKIVGEAGIVACGDVLLNLCDAGLAEQMVATPTSMLRCRSENPIRQELESDHIADDTVAPMTYITASWCADGAIPEGNAG